MIRVNVAFPAGDWQAVPSIRSAARALSGLPGLVEARVSIREESGPGTASAGPVAEVAFETVDQMRDALGADAWQRLVVAGEGGDAIVRAYAVANVALGGQAGSGTTDVELATEGESEAEAEPLSTVMELPLSRPPQPDEEEGEGSAGSGS